MLISHYTIIYIAKNLIFRTNCLYMDIHGHTWSCMVVFTPLHNYDSGIYVTVTVLLYTTTPHIIKLVVWQCHSRKKCNRKF